MLQGKRTHPLAARVKKIMQQDDQVGRMSAATPVLIGCAAEMFIKDLCKSAAETADQIGVKTISPGVLKQCIVNEKLFDFLTEHVADVEPLKERGRPAPSSSDSRPRKRMKSPQEPQQEPDKQPEKEPES